MIHFNHNRSNQRVTFSASPIVKLNADMRDRGVLIGRPFPPLNKWCRISTGKTEDVAKFCEEIKGVLG